MPPKGLIARVNRKMREFGATQSNVALACRMSQPHLSRVLRSKVKLAAKTTAKLERWLSSSPESPPETAATLETIAEKIANLGPKRRMQFMQLLDAVDRLLGR